MPLDKLALILVLVFTAAAATAGVATLVAGAMDIPVTAAFALPVLPLVFLVLRVAAERLRNRR